MKTTLPGAAEKFLRYVKIDTQSDPDSSSVPTSEKELDLARLLVKELMDMGAEDVKMCKAGCVYATIPSNCDAEAPVVGFIAHMDTSPDVTGANVSPRIVENYQGGDIILNSEKGIILPSGFFKSEAQLIGQDLIVTDGTTLLGADDKAGVAEIMYMAEYLLNHPEIKHGVIKIGFTTDEEVGCCGANAFDIEGFGADFAYTVDGMGIDEYNCESFNAADATVTVHGLQVHPGDTKNRMINSITISKEFDNMIPSYETCEHSEGREGYFHLSDIDGTVSLTKMQYLIRDFDMDGFNRRKEFMRRICQYLNSVYGQGTVDVEFEDSYFSMYNSIKEKPDITEKAIKAFEACGINPKIVPIRGGTDGSILSGRGLACPNLSAGYQGEHSVCECVSVQALDTCANVLIKLAVSFAE